MSFVPFGEGVRPERWADWCKLAADAAPFVSPQVFSLSCALAGTGEPTLCEVVEKGALRGVLPLVRDHERLVSLENDHLPHFDYVGESDAIGALWETIAADRHWNRLVLKNVPTRSALAGELPRLAKRDRFPCAVREGARHPYFSLPGFEDRLSPKFRVNLRRCDRKLGGVTLERVTGFDASSLDEALRLEGMAWKSVAETSILSDPRIRRFYEGLARFFSERGQWAIHFLRAGERRIASLLTVEAKGTLYALKIGYDPAFAPASPGHLVIWKTAEDAEKRGALQLDFLGRDDEWKLKWTDRVFHHRAFVVYKRSLRGYASFTMREALKPRLPAVIKDPLRVFHTGCQQSCKIGDHSLKQRFQGRLKAGLGVKSKLRRLVTVKKSQARIGSASAFAPGDWVRVLDVHRLQLTLDVKETTRGLWFVPQQWLTCGKVFRVQSVVQRMRDDAGNMRPVHRTVLLEGVDCTGPDAVVTGCGRHCPLMFRDEWLEPAQAPAGRPSVPRPGLYARVRSVEDIRATLDVRGRRDGLMFMEQQMAAYAGRRYRIVREVAQVFEHDRWVLAGAPFYVLESLQCDGSVLGAAGPCDRRCALIWHADWLHIEPPAPTLVATHP